MPARLAASACALALAAGVASAQTGPIPPAPPVAAMTAEEQAFYFENIPATSYDRNKVDVHGQFALDRLQKRPDLHSRMWFWLYDAATSRDVLAGVYLEDQGVPAQRAQAMGGWWKDILAGGRTFRCYREPPGEKPIVVIANSIRSIPATMDRALPQAFLECGFGYLVARLSGASQGCEMFREPQLELGVPGGGGAPDTVMPLLPGTYTLRVECPHTEFTREVEVPGDNGVAELTIPVPPPGQAPPDA